MIPRRAATQTASAYQPSWRGWSRCQPRLLSHQLRGRAVEMSESTTASSGPRSQPSCRPLARSARRRVDADRLCLDGVRARTPHDPSVALSQPSSSEGLRWPWMTRIAQIVHRLQLALLAEQRRDERRPRRAARRSAWSTCAPRGSRSAS